MKTKRTVAAILAAIMICTMAMFSFPAQVAADAVSDEVILETGLTDTTEMADINTVAEAEDLAESPASYKITDRAGMDRLSALVNEEKQTLSGYTFYLAADIDMGELPFNPIGHAVTANSGDYPEANLHATASYSVAFQGTFDGNGFVLKNLSVLLPSTSGVGLFGYANNATLKNIGVAGGLILGRNEVGSICGWAPGNVIFINCWNAAAVFSTIGGNDGVAGICGRSVNSGNNFYNCYNLGVVFSRNSQSAGIAGWRNNTLYIKNCYNYGQLISRLTRKNSCDDQFTGFNALTRCDATTGNSSVRTLGANNYFRDDCGQRSYKEAKAAGLRDTTNEPCMAEDDGQPKTVEQFKTLASSLNSATGANAVGTLGAVAGYTVEFTDTTAGYPVITYKAGDEVKVRRLAQNAAETFRSEYLAAHSAIMSKLLAYDALNRCTASEWKPIPSTFDYSELAVIGSAGDLLLATLIFQHQNITDFGVRNFIFTADIDMEDQDLFPGVTWAAPFTNDMSCQFNASVQGNYHVVRHWKGYNALSSGRGAVARAASGGFFGGVFNGTVRNLGLVDAYVAFARTAADKTSDNEGNPFYGYTYPGLMAGYTSGSSQTTLNNCFATGELHILEKTAYQSNNVSSVLSRIMGSSTNVHISNCWGRCRVVLDYNSTAGYARCIGSSANDDAESAIDNVMYVATGRVGAADHFTGKYQSYIGVAQNQTVFALNGAFLEQGICWYGEEGSDNVLWGDCADYAAYITRAYSVLNPDLFADNGAALNTLLALAASVTAGETPATLETAADLYAAEVAFSEQTLKNEYPYLAPYSQVATYQNFGFSPDDNLRGIATAADWLAAVTASNGKSVANSKSYHFLNDIDFGDEEMLPFGYGNTTNAKFYGHEHVLKNVHIKTEGDNNCGLIALLGTSGLIRDLGIESGLIEGSSDAESHGTAAIVGYLNGQIIRCWNGATVKNETAKGDRCVAGIAGRGMSSSLIDSCYNIGTIQAPNSTHVSAINDWAQTGGGVSSGKRSFYSGKVYNCFNTGALSPTSGGSTHMVRGGLNDTSNAGLNEELKIDYQANLWSTTNLTNVVGNGSHTNTGKNKGAAFYTSGELAYTLNTSYVEGYGSQPYFKVENSKTVLGTAEEYAVKVTLYNGASKVGDYYWNTGSEHELGALIGADATYAVTSGEGSISGSVFTVGYSNETVVTATPLASPLDKTALNTFVTTYTAKNLSYYTDEFEGMVTTAAARLAVNWYTTQEAIDGELAALNAAKAYNAAPNLPRASERASYTDAPGYMLANTGDMIYWKNNPTAFTRSQTLYLANDIDMTGVSFNYINATPASLDGRGYTLRGISITTTGPSNVAILYDFKGDFVRNITFDDCSVSGYYGRSLVVGTVNRAYPLTLEDINITNCTVTATYSGSGDSNRMGVLMALPNSYVGAVTIRNIYMYNTTMQCNTNGHTMNAAFVVGQPGTTTAINAENVVLESCTMSGAFADTAGVGFIFGGVEGGAPVTLTNAAVIHCTGRSTSYDYTIAGQLKQEASLTLNNVLTYGNNTVSPQLVRAQFEQSGSEAPGVLTATNVYTDQNWGVWNSTGKESLKPEGFNLSQTAERFTEGELIYDFNKRAGKNLLAVDSSGNLMAASDTDKAPVKVTFHDQDSTDYRYTDINGALRVAEPAPEESADHVFSGWSLSNTAPAGELPASFTEDCSYTAKFATANNTVVGSLEEQINMRFKLDLDHYEADHVRVVKYDENGNTSRRTRGIAAYEPVDGGRYEVDVKLAPAQLTDAISIVLIKEDEEVRTFTYSVATYLKALKGLDGASDALIDLCSATLAYGAAAQVYFDYNADDLADDDYMSAVSYATRSTAKATVQGTRAAAGLKAASVTAAIESGVALHFYFTPADTPAESYTFTLNGNPIGATMVGGRYMVEVYGIPAPNLGDYYTVEVNGAYRVQYSAMCFVAKMQTNSDDKLVSLVNGMKLYYDAAVAYFGA